MALANFFDKAALSAASLLRGANVDTIRDRLLRHIIGVAFDTAAARAAEGRHTLELLTNLLARLYPQLAIVPLPASAGDSSGLADAAMVAKTLRERAMAINPRIELSGCLDNATMLLVVGETAPPPGQTSNGSAPAHAGSTRPVVYAGSSGWNARLSGATPVGSGASNNPFGAGAAACLAAAAAFRIVFAEELGIVTPPPQAQGLLFPSDEQTAPASTELSLLDLEVSAGSSPRLSSTNGLPMSVDIGETFLVGAGAIGQAAIWALSRTPGLAGMLHVIDGEPVELSNLQRYVLTTQRSVGAAKADLSERAFARASGDAVSARNAFAVAAHPTTWAEYVAARGDYQFDRVLLALDSAEDRMAAQASLPRWIANAWTQPENLGVSRHDLIGERPCVCCLYIPSGPRKSKDVLYAEVLRCTSPAELMEVRTLLHNGRPIGRDFILRAAARLGVPPDDLLPFAEQSLDEFYVSALCGGVVLRLGGQLGSGRPAEVPMAFQSALAGILLAAELVAEAAELRTRLLPARTEVDLIHIDFTTPRTLLLNSPATKHPSGRCICQDPMYRTRYAEKYPQEVVL